MKSSFYFCKDEDARQYLQEACVLSYIFNKDIK